MGRIGSWWNNVQRLFIRITSASNRESRNDPVQKDEPHDEEKSKPTMGIELRGESVRRDESATQFQGLPSETMDLVIGFDFGTSCSKVIIRSPFALRSRATAVSWHLGNGNSTYLLPTVLHENAYGEFSLVPSDSAKHAQRDLKINLMDKVEDTGAQARTAAYIGLALRSARQWLLDTQKDVYGTYHLRWALNIGIPSAGYDDENMRLTFGSVARAAWKLSLQPDLPTLDTAAEALRIAGGKSDSAIDIEVVPEIAAEVVGYARSRLRSEGLHVMVDVGASTIDICGFVLHSRDGEDRYELLTALVKRLGIHDLHLRRMDKIKVTDACVTPSVPTSLSPYLIIPNAGREYIYDINYGSAKMQRPILFKLEVRVADICSRWRRSI